MLRKNKLMKRMVAVAMSVAITLPLICSSLVGNISRVDAATTMTAEQITKNMSIGWNLGNSLESTGLGEYANPVSITEYEKYWGNPVVTKELIKAVKDKGFNTVRIPVTWYEHVSKDNGKYTIDAKWMNRVKEVVDYAYSQNMYVILNVHHENWINRSDFASSYNSMSPELTKIWEQIATAFANYDQRLIFEGMNEPRETGKDYEWSGNSACYDVVNKLNADFVKTVRSVSSPYKDTRLLMIPGYAASCYASSYGTLQVPNDKYVAVSIHAYSPYDFTMGNGNHSTFSNENKAALDSIFKDIRTYFLDKDIPVVIGEFSASNYNNESARVSWANYYLTWTKKLGIPCVLWDNNCNTNSGNPSEAHGYLNRANNKWYSESEKVVNEMMSVMKNSSIVWASEKKNDKYSHSDINSANSTYTILNNSSGVSIGEYCTDSYKITSTQLSDKREIAVKYDGNQVPKLAFVNSSWKNWKEVSAYDVDSKNKVAYFLYDDIKNSWGGNTSEIGYVYVCGAGLKIYKVASLPKAEKVTSSNNTTQEETTTASAQKETKPVENATEKEEENKNDVILQPDNNVVSSKKTYIYVEPNNKTIDISAYSNKKLVEVSFSLSKVSTGSGAVHMKTKSGSWIGSESYQFNNSNMVTIDLSKYNNVGRFDLYMWWNSVGAKMQTIRLGFTE